MALVTINDRNWRQHLTWADPDTGERKARGLAPTPEAVKRAFRDSPYYAGEFPDALLIPEGEWPARIAEQEAKGNSAQHVRDIGNAGQQVPSYDQDSYGYCLGPGTAIRMAGGGERPIEEVKVLDEVVSGKGNVHRVGQHHVREYQGDLVTIRTNGSGRLCATPNHRVVTKRGFVPAGALTKDDRVFVPPSYHRVSALKRKPYSGLVYNLGVEVDHSYVAEGVAVLNCWAHSSTSAVTIVRAAMGEPYIPLSAFSVACKIKDFRDEGGEGIESLSFIADKGIAPASVWPMQSTDRSLDNPTVWAEATHFKCSLWWTCSQDDQRRRQQVASASLLGIPVVADMNWWSHSICLIRVLSGTKTRVWNSWGENWGDHGVGDLEGSRAWPDDAVIPAVMLPAVS